jgi:acetaldehyde dehydrogenase (acetylating)
MLRDSDLVSIQEVRLKVEKSYAAFQKFRSYSQEQVDAIVEAMAAAGRANAQPLAEMAVQETGMGNVQDKVGKNLLNADLLPRAIRGMKTVGVLREIPEQKVIEIGVPVGVVAAILPTTNPTSTVIYKSIISVKGGNTIVISPHPRAKNCTCYTADILLKAAVQAGAPEDIIQCITQPTMEATHELMRHHRTGVILSTGGSGIVKAAYSSGKPAFGVGPGNVPVLIEESADLPEAVRKTVVGKSFDYGTVCSSEQTVVAPQSLRDAILRELQANKAYLCNEAQAKTLARLLLTPNWTVNADCVGQSPTKIAQMAGFEIPPDTSIMVAEIQGVGKQHPLSAEKLSPVLSVYFVKDFAAALDACEGILRFGGLGHTCVIYSRDDARILEFGKRMPAFRVLVNTPAPQGSTGVTTGILPAMTLGCGAMAGNVTGDNVGPLHLINIKRIAYEIRKPEEAFTVPTVSSSKADPAVSRSTVAAAVEKYLAERGIPVTAQPAASATSVAPQAPSTPRQVSSAVIPNVSSAVVDRFLSARRVANPGPAAATSCGCALPAPAPAAAAPPAPAPPTPAPEPELPIADFVCESDVRAAQRQSQKIYIGPKTIVTPAARELAAAQDTLVLAKR